MEVKWFTAAGIRTRTCTLSYFGHFPSVMAKLDNVVLTLLRAQRMIQKKKKKRNWRKGEFQKCISVTFTFKVPGKLHRGTFVSQVEITRTKVNCEQIWLFLQMERKSINSKWTHVLKHRRAVVHFLWIANFLLLSRLR